MKTFLPLCKSWPALRLSFGRCPAESVKKKKNFATAAQTLIANFLENRPISLIIATFTDRGRAARNTVKTTKKGVVKRMYNFKPCPFCGKRPFMRHVCTMLDTYKVYCGNEDCCVSPQTRWYYKKEQAVAAWNRRNGKADD